MWVVLFYFIGTVGSFYIYIYRERERERERVAFLSFFWLEMWGSGGGKCEDSGKILVNLPF